MIHKNKKLLIFISITFLELLLIFYLFHNFWLKKNTLGVSISPINKNDIVINPNQNLTHFFEYKPNTIIKSTAPSWFRGIPGEATINSDSLNERFDYPVEKAPKTFRIVTLGDSFTFGWLVNTAENYPEKLENKLNLQLKCPGIDKFEVINLGTPGDDIEYAANRFQIRGKKYQPDLVLWLVKNDDFEEIIDYIRPAGDQIYNSSKQEVQNPLNVVESWTKAKNNLVKHYGQDFIMQYQIDKLYKFTEVYKNKLLLFTFDSTQQRYKNLLLDYVKKNPQSLFYTELPNLKQPEEAFKDGHPNSQGYSLMVEKLFDYLVSPKIIPCNQLF